jgi:hypothetical protein
VLSVEHVRAIVTPGFALIVNLDDQHVLPLVAELKSRLVRAGPAVTSTWVCFLVSLNRHGRSTSAVYLLTGTPGFLRRQLGRT